MSVFVARWAFAICALVAAAAAVGYGLCADWMAVFGSVALCGVATCFARYLGFELPQPWGDDDR